ncbi:MAG TPA: nucleotide exchange factor GrpE [Candidatus Limnocylindrales bacterium]|nr:nucleotide exchange factor GrpE [Candidatus Limnocylindrales bacterium]
MTDPAQKERPQTDGAAGPSTDELLDLLRRERADFRNYQRRVAEQRAADAEGARGRVLEPLFPLLDDLRRAFAEVPPDLADDPWAQGIAMLRSQLDTTLAGLGLEPVGTVGEPFDPTRHEAVHHEPDPTADGQVVDLVIRPGYRLGGRLLRPAEVVVRGPLVEGGRGSASESTGPSDDARRPEPTRHGRSDDVPNAGG